MSIVPILSDETAHDLSASQIGRRLALLAQLQELPSEVITHLKHLQPQVGCFNRCSFCSQSAGTSVWQFTQSGLRDFLAALKYAATVACGNPSLGMGRISHRPGVIFPYLDNDIGSYPHLDDYIQILWNDFGAKVRLASVGYSARNPRLAKMHEKIATELPHAIAGVRFSFTPYTFAWTKPRGKFENRKELISDFANALRTYVPVFELIGFGKETACVEIRFRPLIRLVDSQLLEANILNHHVITLGPHLLICQTDDSPDIRTASILEVSRNQTALSEAPRHYYLFTSDTQVTCNSWQETAEKIIRSDFDATKFGLKPAELYRFENADGFYYSINPFFSDSGAFNALQLYPQTTSRPKAGFSDATRFFLNALLHVKETRGIGRRETFVNATQSDVNDVLQLLVNQADRLEHSYKAASSHIRNEILPIVEAYREALVLAGLSDWLFFDRNFTVDTGQIVNQGRAQSEFKGITSHCDEPVTPQEERGFGNISVSSSRGNVWRVAPLPFTLDESELYQGSVGLRNSQGHPGTLQVQELDSRFLKPLREYRIKGVELEHYSLSDARSTGAYPGLTDLSIQQGKST